MSEFSPTDRIAVFLLAWAISASVGGSAAHARAAGSAAQETVSSQHGTPIAKPKLDLSGHKRAGKASFYARKFTGKKMADGTRMDPHRDNAASNTLPLGTTAKVTNLNTGQSAVVTIEDRGPHVKGRIVDLSPSTAQKIGITRDEGVVKVEVAPIVIPLPDGNVKPGDAAQDAKTGMRSPRDPRE